VVFNSIQTPAACTLRVDYYNNKILNPEDASTNIYSISWVIPLRNVLYLNFILFYMVMTQKMTSFKAP